MDRFRCCIWYLGEPRNLMGKKAVLKCKKCKDEYTKKYGGEKVSVEACPKCRQYFCPTHRWNHKYRNRVCVRPEDRQLSLGLAPSPVVVAQRFGKG